MLIRGEVQLLAAWTHDGCAYEVYRARLQDGAGVIVVNAFGPDEMHRLRVVPILGWSLSWLDRDDAGRTRIVEHALSPMSDSQRVPRRPTGKRLAVRRAPMARGLPRGGTFALPARRALPAGEPGRVRSA